ncbi:hypothetical protein AGRO_2111 [Agrobacterium sp. ATCC 31749]|nr:hypothetical protein AGRO_2111 [Agrobacterium sp. ATCC 31749]
MDFHATWLASGRTFNCDKSFIALTKTEKKTADKSLIFAPRHHE